MIEAVESLLLSALAPLSAGRPELSLRAGPREREGVAPELVICVHGLKHTPRDTPGAERQSPCLGARLRPQPGADARTWTLAGVEVDELSELLAPDRALIRGEDYTAEGRPGAVILRLRTALAGGVAPVAWVLGAAARGYHSRGACTLDLSIVARAEHAADADALMGAALVLGLPVLAAIPPLEAPWGSFPDALPPGAGVRARIDRPEVTLRGQARRWVSGAPGHVEVATNLALTGELELTVAIGAHEPAGVIADVVGKVNDAAFTIVGAAYPRE